MTFANRSDVRMAADRTRSSFAFVFTFGCAAVLLLWLALSTDESERQIVYSSLAMFALCCSLLHVVALGAVQKSLADFRLGSWMLGFGAMAYGLATLSLMEPLIGPQSVIDRSLTVTALLHVGLGFILFAVGYRLGPSRQIRFVTLRVLKPSTDRHIPIASARIFVAYTLGIAATAALVLVQGGYGYIGGAEVDARSTVSPLVQPLTALTFLRTAALFGLSARWARHKVPAKFIPLVVIASAEVTIGLVTGVKESFVVVAVAVGIPIILTSKRRRIPWVTALVGVGVFVLFVTPFVTGLRGEVRAGGQRLDFASSASLGLDSLTGEHNGTTPSARENLEQVVSRVRLVDNTILILDKTPAIYPYRPVSDILVAPVTGLIPRAIWPSKPLRLTGREFYETYYQGLGQSSSAVTMQGSLLLHGGILTLCIGMFLLGALVRGIDDAVTSYSSSAAGLLPLVLFIPFVKQELEVTTFLASLPIFVLTFLFSLYCITSKAEEAPRRPRGQLGQVLAP